MQIRIHLFLGGFGASSSHMSSWRQSVCGIVCFISLCEPYNVQYIALSLMLSAVTVGFWHTSVFNYHVQSLSLQFNLLLWSTCNLHCFQLLLLLLLPLLLFCSYVRSQIGQAIKLRLTPEVRFEYDDTYDELEKVTLPL